MSLFPIFSPRATVPVSVSLVDSPVSTANATTYTFSGAALGAADAARKIVVGVTADPVSGSDNSISTLTVAGVSATFVHAVYRDLTYQAALWEATVPTGTTGDIVVTFTGTTMAQCGLGVWRVLNAGTFTDTAGVFVTSVQAADTINVPANGAAIGIGQNNNGAATFTWGGLTEDFDHVVEAGVHTNSGASDAFATAQTALSLTFDASAAGNVIFAAGAWGPA